MPRPKAEKPQEKCRVCKGPVQIMCRKGTGICSQLCERKEKED